MASQVRSETALIRPYADLSPVDKALADVRLHVAFEEYEAGAVSLSDVELRDSTLRLVLPDPMDVKAAIAATAVPPVDCGLVVIASARSNRVSSTLVQAYLKPDSWNTELTLDRSASDLIFNDSAGFALTVAIVLLHDLQPAPLRPHMAGTWLARRDFSVAPLRTDTSFSPEAMTDDVRKQFGLRPGTMSFVHVGDWSDAERLSDEVRVYVDTDSLYLMLAHPSDPVSVQLQTQLAINVTSTLAEAIAQEVKEEDAPPSPNDLAPFDAARRFFDSLAGRLELAVSDVLALAAGQPSVLRAHLEAAFDLRGATAAALKEK